MNSNVTKYKRTADLIGANVGSVVSRIPESMLDPAMRAVLDPSWLDSMAEVMSADELAATIRDQTLEFSATVLAGKPQDAIELGIMVQMTVAQRQALRQAELSQIPGLTERPHSSLMRLGLKCMETYAKLLDSLLKYRHSKLPVVRML